MDKKLISLLSHRIPWKLLFKTGLVTAGLFFVWRSNFSWWSLAIFLATALGVYFSFLPERQSFRISFSLLLIFGLFASSEILSGNATLLILVLFFTCLFIIIGLAEFLFKDKFLIYGILNTVLLLATFLLFFFLRPFNLYWFLEILLFIALVSIFYESLFFLGGVWRKRNLMIALVFGFLGVEIAWIVSFLPLGIINAAAFLTLIFLLLRDSFAVHFQGFLDLSYLFRQLTFFVLMSTIIFAASVWTI